MNSLFGIICFSLIFERVNQPILEKLFNEFLLKTSG